MHHCMQIADDKGSVELAECSAAVADTDMTPLPSPTLTAAAGFERLPQGQACANGTTLTTRAACQDALKSLMSTLPAGCKDNTGCCTGENLPYGCSFRSDNDFVFNDNKQSPSKYVAGTVAKQSAIAQVVRLTANHRHLLDLHRRRRLGRRDPHPRHRHRSPTHPAKNGRWARTATARSQSGKENCAWITTTVCGRHHRRAKQAQCEIDGTS
eukprot:SAG25_NODE_1721_length_2455_cov_309.615874_3_plen_212_part_00